MMKFNPLFMKKGHDRRIRAGHLWIYSNEIDTKLSPLKSYQAGEEVEIYGADKTFIGMAYINPHSLITARIYSHNQGDSLTVTNIYKKLFTANETRQALFSTPHYRLFYSEGDFLPGLIIDRFDQDFSIQINTAGLEAKKTEIAQAMQKLFPHLTSMTLKNNSASRKLEVLEQYIEPLVGEIPKELTIVENDITFYAPLDKGQKTGWFYDHRMNRQRFADFCAHKNVLDVCSYVGAWGIQAAIAGAKHVDFIDSSAIAVQYIKRNAELNNVAQKINVFTDDAFDALKKLYQEKSRYDVIVLDPPAFVKKSKDKNAGLLAYQRLNEIAVKLLNVGGILFTCSCSMHVSAEDLTNLLQRVAYNTKSTLQILEQRHQAPDHPVHLNIPETNYLKVFVIKKI